MKDQEFIALLNLYIDGEISAADAARLEAEVRGDPRRHQVYRQYCQMHRASRILAEEFRAAEAAGVARKVVPLAEAAGRRRAPVLVAFGGLAAAAAFAVLLVLRPSSPGPVAAGSAVAVQPVSTPLSAVPAPEPARGGIVQRPLLAADTLTLVGQTGDRAPGASGQSLGWISEMNFAPLPARVAIDELRFDQRPSQLRPEARMISAPRSPSEAPTEMSAFRFVK
jgi:hypothetical protein